MKYLITALCFFLLLNHTNAQPGTLDKTYANGGSFISGNLHYNIRSSAIQPDNKVIIGGANQSIIDTALNYPYILIRHNTDGSVDSSFGKEGKAITIFPKGYGSGDGWSSVKVLPDGRIVAAGFNYKPTSILLGDALAEGDIVVARFNPDGSPDASFGRNGIVITDLGRNEQVYDMALQPDGKIVLAGVSDIGFNYAPQMLVVRYNADGTLDDSFNSTGYAIYPEDAEAHAVALQEDGKIVLGGSYSVHSYFMLLRYLPDGTLDDSFGTHGRVLTGFQDEGYYLNINNLLIDKQHNILAGGIAEGDKMTVAKYKEDGTPDSSYNKNGIVTLRVGEQQSRVNTMFLQEGNKLLLTGGAGGSAFTSFDIALARLLPDGTVDSSFGTNGITITDLGLHYEGVNSAVMQQDGKVVIAGNSTFYDTVDYYLARYNVGDSRQSPIVRIRRWLQHHGISWQAAQQSSAVRYYTIQRSYDGIVYRDVAKLSPKANSYEDNAAGSTTGSYYRIATTGWDGTRTYSNAVLINDAQQARIFPNPVKDNLQLQGLPSAGKTNVSIVDLNGHVRSTATATGTNYSVNTANLGSGSYLLKIQHGGTATTLPFVKE